jgi:hypothetical protein
VANGTHQRRRTLSRIESVAQGLFERDVVDNCRYDDAQILPSYIVGFDDVPASTSLPTYEFDPHFGWHCEEGGGAFGGKATAKKKKKKKK